MSALKEYRIVDQKSVLLGIPCETWYSILANITDSASRWWIDHKTMDIIIASENKPRDYPEVGIVWGEIVS